MNGHDDPVSELVRIIAVLVARTGTDQAVLRHEELAAVPGGVQLVVGHPGLLADTLGIATDDGVIVKLLGMPPASPAAPPQSPKPDPADRLPRRRSPFIGCHQTDGTWVHGRPHDCPRSARGWLPWTSPSS